MKNQKHPRSEILLTLSENLIALSGNLITWSDLFTKHSEKLKHTPTNRRQISALERSKSLKSLKSQESRFAAGPGRAGLGRQDYRSPATARMFGRKMASTSS